MKVTSRHHLRRDEIEAIESAISRSLGVTLDGDDYELVEFADHELDLVLVDGRPAVSYWDGDPFLTVRGANEHQPTGHVVTVDAGAVSFVSDGADVMRPGITEATDDIESGDLVAINEAAHGKFLAIGRSRVDSAELLGDQGKVIESLHHVGDDFYEFAG